MIHEQLLTGRANAIKAKVLAERLGCPIREITQAVQRERRAGYPICVNTSGKDGGYYLAETAEDIDTTCRQLFKRAGEMHKTRKTLLKSKEKIQQ